MRIDSSIIKTIDSLGEKYLSSDLCTIIDDSVDRAVHAFKNHMNRINCFFPYYGFNENDMAVVQNKVYHELFSLGYVSKVGIYISGRMGKAAYTITVCIIRVNQNLVGEDGN